MKYDYNVSTLLNNLDDFQIFENVLLSDLLRIDLGLDMKLDFALAYLFSKKSKHKIFTKIEDFNNCSKQAVLLLDDWTVCYNNETIVLVFKTGTENSDINLDFHGKITKVTIIDPNLWGNYKISYISTYICWSIIKNKIKHKCNIESMIKDLFRWVHLNSKIKTEKILSSLKAAKKFISQNKLNFDSKSEIVTISYRPQPKCIINLLYISEKEDLSLIETSIIESIDKYSDMPFAFQTMSDSLGFSYLSSSNLIEESSTTHAFLSNILKDELSWSRRSPKKLCSETIETERMGTIPESLNLSLKTDDSTYPHETFYQDYSENPPTLIFDTFNISNVSSLQNISPISPDAFAVSSFYTTRSDCKCNECNLF